MFSEKVLDSFCGCNFTKISCYNHSLSLCFETLVLAFFPFTLLAATSSYYVGNLRAPDVRQNYFHKFALRKTCNLVSFVVACFSLFKDLIFFQNSLYPLIISGTFKVVALGFHHLYLMKLCKVHFLFKRGPGAITFCWLLTFPYYLSSFLRAFDQLYFMLSTQIGANTPEKWDLSVYTSVVISVILQSVLLSCQVLYLSTLIRKNTMYRTISFSSDTPEQNRNDLTDTNEELSSSSANILSK